MSAVETIGTETLASYVARYFVARKGFSADVPQQATELASACDIVLTRTDGFTFQVLCIVDREANPHAQFGLSPDTVRTIGRKCLESSGRVGSRNMPIRIYIVEIGPGLDIDENHRRLQGFWRDSIFSKTLCVPCSSTRPPGPCGQMRPRAHATSIPSPLSSGF